MKSDGYSYRNIAKILACSLGMVQNAFKAKPTQEIRGRPRKTSKKTDRLIALEAKKDPFISSSKLLKATNLNISARTVRRRLVESKLPSRSPRKVPMLSKKNIKRRMMFASEHKMWSGDQGIKKWRNILWSDECKFNLFGSDSRHNVRRPPNTEFNPRYTKKNRQTWGWQHYGMGMFLLVWSWSYTPHRRDNDQRNLYEHTPEHNVATCRG